MQPAKAISPLTAPSLADKSGFCRAILISVLAELTFAERGTLLNGTFCSARSFRAVWSEFVRDCGHCERCDLKKGPPLAV